MEMIGADKSSRTFYDYLMNLHIHIILVKEYHSHNICARSNPRDFRKWSKSFFCWEIDFVVTSQTIMMTTFVFATFTTANIITSHLCVPYCGIAWNKEISWLDGRVGTQTGIILTMLSTPHGKREGIGMDMNTDTHHKQRFPWFSAKCQLQGWRRASSWNDHDFYNILQIILCLWRTCDFNL